MQAMPDARQQSFEEIYGPPENFLEIEVQMMLFYTLMTAVPISMPSILPITILLSTSHTTTTYPHKQRN